MRRTYIDWLRGVAVLIMIEWHSVDAWTSDAERGGQPFYWLAVLGGWAAPLFLFLAGLAVPMAADAQLRKGRTVPEVSRALQRRGWQIFFYAHVFRVQSYLLNPYAVWHSIFKPDILNILGLGLVLVAWLWGRTSEHRARLALFAAALLTVLIVTPYSRLWEWPTMLHPRLEAYIRPNGGFGQFPLFPWLVFMMAGGIVGLWIARGRAADQERAFHLRLAAVGALAVVAGWLGALLPSVLPTAGVTSWSFLSARTGWMILMVAGAWLWYQRPTASRWSPLVLFGQTSLFVYWVHVELAYGLLSAFLKRSLTIPQSLIAYALFTLFMLWLAAWWKRRSAAPWIPDHLIAQRTSA